MKRVFTIFWVLITVVATTAYQAHARGEDSQESDIGKESLLSRQSSSDTIIDPIVNWPTFCSDQQTGEINTSFNCFGVFGNGFHGCYIPGWPNMSFESPSGSGVEYLFAGAIWIGAIVGQDTLVSVGADGWQYAMEMFPPEYPAQGSVTKFESPADFSMRAEFTDTATLYATSDGWNGRPHIPLNVCIANRSHAWRTDPQNWTVIYDVVITNMGNMPIEDGYVGFYFDADVCYDCSGTSGFTDDVTGSIMTNDSQRVAYIIDNEGDFSRPPNERTPRIFAFKFLETSFAAPHTSFNWWISNGSSPLDFGPRERPYTGVWEEPFRDFGTGGLGTPEGDANKYYIMRNREIDYDQVYTCVIPQNDTLWLYPCDNPQCCDFANGSDTRFLMSVGPFNLLPDSSMRFLFATFTGDSVHTDPTNINNLPYNPDQYLANLDFSRVLENGDRSDSLAATLLDPELPVIGLQVEYKDEDSVVVRWDPWVFDDVEGFEVYLWEVPPDSLPYPGVVPPWLEPDQLNLVASLGRAHEYIFDALDSGMFYLVNVAHRTTTRSVGDPGEALAIWLGDRSAAPQVEKEYIYLQEGDPAIITWTAPAGVTVDHYNIYRFEDAEAAAAKFHPFYDEGFHAPSITPKDTFLVDSQYYYYYAMDMHAQVPGNVTSFTDTGVDDGMVYVITAVDEQGFESHFSIDVTALVVEPRTEDVLVITNSRAGGLKFMIYDSVKTFYDSILSGYSYDIYNHSDSVSFVHCPSQDCADWHDFMRYRLLIVDDGILEFFGAYSDLEVNNKGLTKYLLSGGKLAYFGSFSGFLSFWMSNDAGFYPAANQFIRRFFGIDSIFYVGPGYFFSNDLPLVDTFFAFSMAEAVGSMPDVSYDTTRYPFTSSLQTFWPSNTPPSVSTFKVNDDGETTHLFKALPGVNSMNENEPVGVKTTPEGTETYLFGFHLWYMTYDEGRALIESIFWPPAKVVITPDTMFAFYANAIDPMMATVHLGNFREGRTPGDIVPSTMRINETIVPTSWAILPSYPGFTGDVMEMVFPIAEFLAGYGAFWDTTLQTFTVSGEFGDDTSFAADGKVVLIGHMSGDLNLDGVVNVADLVYLADFLFRYGQPPVVNETADVDGSCRVNVADVTYLVSYLFRGGPIPLSCPR